MRCNVTCEMVKFTYFILDVCVCLCILYCIDVSRTPRELHETAKKTNSKNYIVAIVVVFGLVFNGFLYHVVCILPNRNVKHANGIPNHRSHNVRNVSVFESMCVDCTLFLSNVKILPDHIISVWPSNLFILAPAVCLYLSSCGRNYIFGKPLEPRAKATFG